MEHTCRLRSFNITGASIVRQTKTSSSSCRTPKLSIAYSSYVRNPKSSKPDDLKGVMLHINQIH